MTKATNPSAAGRGGPSDHHPADLRRENQELRDQLGRMQPLVTAALLTTTAFRLRDRDAEIRALRLLVEAFDGLEEGAGEI